MDMGMSFVRLQLHPRRSPLQFPQLRVLTSAALLAPILPDKQRYAPRLCLLLLIRLRLKLPELTVLAALHHHQLAVLPLLDHTPLVED
jgi:hypothetical protein